MMKFTSVLLLASALLAGCGKDDTCESLSKQICEGAGVSCDATRAWLDKEMVGPNDEKLNAQERAAACKMIQDDKDAMTGFREKAKSDLAAAK